MGALIAFEWNGEDISLSVKAKAEDGTNQTALLLCKYQKMLCQYVTGTLMRSIKLSSDGEEDGTYKGADFMQAADIRRGGSAADLLDDSVGGVWDGEVFTVYAGSFLWYAVYADERSNYVQSAWAMAGGQWASLIGDSRLSPSRMGAFGA